MNRMQSLNLNEYQKLANDFINEPRYKEPMDYLINTGLGLCGESGEFADLIKKIYYHGHTLDYPMVEKLQRELGDVLWYIAEGCKALDVSLNDIALLNIKKLEDRHKGNKFVEANSVNKDESKEARNFVSIYANRKS